MVSMGLVIEVEVVVIVAVFGDRWVASLGGSGCTGLMVVGSKGLLVGSERLMVPRG